jgi:hypothetical protein
VRTASVLGDNEFVCGLDSSGSGYDPVAGFCEHGNELCHLEAGNFFIRCVTLCHKVD